MKLKGLLFLTAILLVASQTSVWAQTGQDYTDPAGKFKLSLLGEWRAVSYSDAVGRQKIEFVYRDRSEGLLKVSRERINGGSLANHVRNEEENLKVYRSGFERSASEAFGGGPHKGIRFSFFNTAGGKQLANTYYYLEDGDSVWVLRFIGKRGAIDTIRNLTDQMARSFQSL